MSAIHQEIVFDAAPARVYEAYVDAAKHSAFTGAKAEFDAAVGGSFSCHEGQIVGRTIELVPNERIVQAWRVAGWDPGVYTLVKIELSAEGDGTKLSLDHTGIPDGMQEHLDGGWHARYWAPLQEYLR